jgi:polyisoprenoid-binding protein YceI
MKTYTKLTSTFGVVIGMTVLAAATVLPQYTFSADSRLWVDGTSTVRDFTCQAGDFGGSVDPTTTAAPLAVTGLAASVQGAEAVVRVAAMECGNGTMNSHLRKALKADNHPTIVYRLVSYEVVSTGNGEAQVRLVGNLTMAGQTKPITMDATARTSADGALRVRGSKEIVMSEYGVKPPSLMLGTMKVGDKVTVHYEVGIGR